jgi:enamine deaminase RidA (YjgF/YER057c/UK114 family)
MDQPSALQLVHAPSLHGGGPYAYTSIAPPGALVFTAGACPLEANEALIGVGDIQRQAQQVVANLSEALAAAGAALTDALKTTVHVASADHGDLLAAWEIVHAAFGDHEAPGTLLAITHARLPGPAGRGRGNSTHARAMICRANSNASTTTRLEVP